MDKINIISILSNYGWGGTYRGDPTFKAVIKEIVEAVIDRCAEEAKLTNGTYHPFLNRHFGQVVDKGSILRIKNEITYE